MYIRTRRRSWAGGRRSHLDFLDLAFRWVFGLSLFLFAGAKVHLLLIQQAVLQEPDLILFFLARRTLLWLVVGAELGVSAWLLTVRSAKSAAVALLWLCSLFLCYRAGLWLMGAGATCGCGGSLYRILGIAPQDADKIATMWLGIAFSASLLRLLVPRLYAGRPGRGPVHVEAGQT
jgi:hypothetical protein